MRTSRFSILLVACALAVCAVPAAHAVTPPARWYAGFAAGGGVGAANVEGARIEFGRESFAFAIALHGGRVLSPGWRVGLHLDAVGASSGRVVPLSSPYPVSTATTEHRVAINHLSVVATCTPGDGLFFARAGAGLAESFTEDWTAPAQPVRRSFGPGVVAGLGVAPRLESGTRVPVALDALAGSYAGRTGWGAMLTVGFENR